MLNAKFSRPKNGELGSARSPPEYARRRGPVCSAVSSFHTSPTLRNLLHDDVDLLPSPEGELIPEPVLLIASPATNANSHRPMALVRGSRNDQPVRLLMRMEIIPEKNTAPRNSIVLSEPMNSPKALRLKRMNMPAISTAPRNPVQSTTPTHVESAVQSLTCWDKLSATPKGAPTSSSLRSDKVDATTLRSDCRTWRFWSLATVDACVRLPALLKKYFVGVGRATSKTTTTRTRTAPIADNRRKKRPGRRSLKEWSARRTPMTACPNPSAPEPPARSDRMAANRTTMI